jgi:hypothetical protein
MLPAIALGTASRYPQWRSYFEKCSRKNREEEYVLKEPLETPEEAPSVDISRQFTESGLYSLEVI